MDKLHLLLPYLPYGLIVEVQKLNTIDTGKLTNVDISTPDQYFHDGVSWQITEPSFDPETDMPYHSDQFKPYLRPIEQLVNGDFKIDGKLGITHLTNINEGMKYSPDEHDWVLKDTTYDELGEKEVNKVVGIQYKDRADFVKVLTFGTKKGFGTFKRANNGDVWKDMPNFQWDMWQFLFSHHFDVFDLIGKGHAHEKNT